MTTVASCETEGYNPNAVRLPGDPGKMVPQCTGAWGLFQMGKSGQAGQYDMGNVNWKEQVRNATNRLMQVSEDYWECWDLTYQPSLDSILGMCRCQVSEANWCWQSDICNPPVCDKHGENCRKESLAKLCGVPDSPGDTAPPSDQPELF
ncbi:MAG: hypothetical protein A2Y84_01800 [Candidatus Colwellbacteria bacterium RBG_13_48_8]|uniref:Uncharacterized protein n=1 Tax=Candidatus Colwellbacteria bacterium RBG_13_48_8 TaxID=1797685 RepID=A0A1G1YVJ1_9BACT|nr:MAG: hypothetical protein A2Y84_01800 [Candidatus Colwellbacteria bacterium RBG_13_48_8]